MASVLAPDHAGASFQQAQQDVYDSQGVQQQFPAQPGQQSDQSDDDSPLFQTDDFRIWCMKVIPCTKRFVHDWTVCPFAHAGEKAVRRDPRLVNYTGIACPDMKKTGNCIRGDRCPYAHNVFEYWLHPTRYRTQLCNDGPTCKRSICFFAHSLEQLRVPACKPYVSPEALARASLEAIQQNPHPLAQQLPNPVAAQQKQQQHAAMLAMSGPPSHLRRGGQHAQHQPPSPSSLAASAAPFVPGSMQPQRMSMPPPVPVRGSYDQAACLPMSMGRMPPRRSAPDTPPAADFASASYEAALRHHHAFALAQQQASVHMQTAAASRAQGLAGFQAPVPFSAPLSAHLSSPATSGVLRSSEGVLRMSDGGRISPAGSYRSSEGSHGGGAAASGKGSPDMPTQASADCLPSFPSSDGLAQSLASLKIAMTQQQLAAAAGSNHEVVISTLHQILKEAAAQQQPGRSPPPSPSPAGCGHPSRAPYFIQDGYGGVAPAPNAAPGGPGASPGAQLQVVAPVGLPHPRSPFKFAAPPAPDTYSPDAVAAFQAASAAAAAGYFGQQAVPGARSSDTSLEDAEASLSQSLSSSTFPPPPPAGQGMGGQQGQQQQQQRAAAGPSPMSRPLSNGQLVSLGGALAHALGD